MAHRMSAAHESEPLQQARAAPPIPPPPPPLQPPLILQPPTAQAAAPVIASPSRRDPPPSMQPAYAYTQSSGPAVDPYNAPQTASHAASSSSLPPINLPPIRSIEAQTQPQPPESVSSGAQYPPPYVSQQAEPAPQQQQQPVAQYLPAPSYYAPLPPLLAGMPPTTYQPSFGTPAQSSNVLYRLLPQVSDQRMLSGGRHKKEIKRRTKTGCLTCRKRRIKCDEAHPICRNCQKSKRECLGYDPIFKPQSSPAQLQPAPGPAAASYAVVGSSPTSATQTVLPPLASQQYTTTPQSYGPPLGAQVIGQSPVLEQPHDGSHGDVAPLSSTDAGPTETPRAQIAQQSPPGAQDQRSPSPYQGHYPRG